MGEILIICSYCGRTFLPQRINDHETICRKLRSKPARPIFDSRSQRLKDVALNYYYIQQQTKKLKKKETKKDSQKDWRQKHLNLLQAIKLGRESVMWGGKFETTITIKEKQEQSFHRYVCPHCNSLVKKLDMKEHISSCSREKKKNALLDKHEKIKFNDNKDFIILKHDDGSLYKISADNLKLYATKISKTTDYSLADSSSQTERNAKDASRHKKQASAVRLEENTTGETSHSYTSNHSSVSPNEENVLQIFLSVSSNSQAFLRVDVLHPDCICQPAKVKFQKITIDQKDGVKEISMLLLIQEVEWKESSSGRDGSCGSDKSQ